MISTFSLRSSLKVGRTISKTFVKPQNREQTARWMSSAQVDVKLDPSKTAILCIEFQNEFMTEGGKLYPAVENCIKEKNTLSNALKVIETARSKGYKIVMAPIKFSSDFKELSNEPYGILAGVKEGKTFIASEWGSEFGSKFTPEAKDLVVQGKSGLCAFHSTNLDFILRQNGIQNLAICGFLTNCCVESTMRVAYENGYNVYTLTDCCGATSVEAHDAAVKYTFPMFSHPVTSDEFLKLLV